MSYPNQLSTMTATIAAAGSLSAAVDLAGRGSPVGLLMPAAWDAAVITFAVSNDGVTYRNLQQQLGAGEYSLTVDVDQALPLDPADFVAWRYIKVRSGTAAAPVAQAAGAAIGLCVRPV